MKSKALTIILGMFFLIGMVGAEPTLSNADTTIQNIPLEVIAGSTFQGDFSFDYLSIPDNEDNLPLIIRLDVISNDAAYPVGNDEFEVDGYVDKCTWTILGACILPTTINFDCSEETSLTIEHAIGSEEINNIPDGTFYCYNEEANLKLDEHDTIFLNIKSHPALYPGTYNLIASLYYLTDTYAPIVNILNKDSFDTYYREFDNIQVQVEINDINLESYWIMVFADETITIPFSHETDGVYDFTRNLPLDIQEGDYELKITAKDSSGNSATDNTTLKIDLTAPEIELIESGNPVYNEIVPLKLNITDAKSGVDNQTVYYRLREIVNRQICPESGVPLGNYSCARTNWINFPGSLAELYEQDINITEIGLESGEYWLEVKAQDLLGNQGQLE